MLCYWIVSCFLKHQQEKLEVTLFDLLMYMNEETFYVKVVKGVEM